MIGFVIVTHGEFGRTVVETTEYILNREVRDIIVISIGHNEDPEKLRKMIEQAIKKVKTDEGVIIFTDMFGGSPSNISYSFLEEGRIEVISGLNLPILIRAVNMRDKSKSMSETTQSLIEFGRKSISLASDILKGTSRNN